MEQTEHRVLNRRERIRRDRTAARARVLQALGRIAAERKRNTRAVELE